MERRLGRGLGSLLGQPPAQEDRAKPLELAVDRIRPNPRQPRKSFDPASLEELASSIRSHGVLQPIVVREAVEGYELISGERRWRAARSVGLRAIPAVVRPGVRDDEMLELALVENVQRQDLDAIDRARGFKEMMEVLGITQEAVAQKVGLQRATVTNHIRLLELPPQVQESVGRGLLSMGHARALLAVGTTQTQIRFMERIAREDLSVRQTEHLVRESAKSGSGKRVQTKVLVPHQPWSTDLERRLRESLGTRVTVRNGPGYKGQIIIEYFNRSDLERLCQLLAPRTELD